MTEMAHSHDDAYKPIEFYNIQEFLWKMLSNILKNQPIPHKYTKTKWNEKGQKNHLQFKKKSTKVSENEK